MNRTQPALQSRLLVVDDSEDVLESLQMVLDDLGYQVDTARSGSQALDRVKSVFYGLVLCDVGMPGMSGWQVAEKIRSAVPGTKVFLLTGFADQIQSDDPRLELVDGVLPKPIEIDRLARFLSEQVQAAQSA